jgi:short-subunit dehydrogenase
MRKPVCAVVGVGPGNGAALARRFAAEGYATALLARSTEFSNTLASQLQDSRAYVCDVTSDESIARVFESIRTDLGEVDVLIYNAGSGVWGSVEEISTAQLSEAVRINTVGLLGCAQAVIPTMKARTSGTLLVIGATASRRGGAKTAAFAPAKAAQRSLTESLARHLWPWRIHVALIIVDGVVDLPRTRLAMPDKPDGFFVKPDDVADTAWALTRQAASAWSFEVEARPFGETW